MVSGVKTEEEENRPAQISLGDSILAGEIRRAGWRQFQVTDNTDFRVIDRSQDKCVPLVAVWGRILGGQAPSGEDSFLYSEGSRLVDSECLWQVGWRLEDLGCLQDLVFVL